MESGVHKKSEVGIEKLIKEIKDSADFSKAGAIAIFIGVVRGETPSKEKVIKLRLEAYEKLANKVILSICSDLEKLEEVIDVQIHHFLGDFDVGEDLVYVLVVCKHRKSAFKVLEEAVERYKSEAPIFKKEEIISMEGQKSSYWIAERGDHE